MKEREINGYSNTIIERSDYLLESCKEIPVQEVYRGISDEISLLKKLDWKLRLTTNMYMPLLKQLLPLLKKMAIKMAVKYLYYQLRNVFVSGLVKEVLLRLDKNFIPIILASH